jgi:hypothetical protein
MNNQTNPSRASKLRVLCNDIARAALEAAPGHKNSLCQAAEILSSIARNDERRTNTSEDAIKVLPQNATQDELNAARRRQATRRGADTFLPSLSDRANILPNVFLRSDLFSASRKIQALNERIIFGDTSLLIVNRAIASFNNVTVTLSGYELCQFDRRVYVACLNYYQEQPLSSESDNRHIQTSFYEFAKQMGSAYSVNLHRSIRASLLRLSFAQLRIRQDRLNLEVPKLLSVSLEHGTPGSPPMGGRGPMRGGDQLWLRITESIADLFGPGRWTAIDRKAIHYDGLRGWLACFYSTHLGPQWLSIEKLYQMTGYESRFGNFRQGLCAALDNLKFEDTPLSSRIANYHFSEDGKKIQVHRVKWGGALPNM